MTTFVSFLQWHYGDGLRSVLRRAVLRVRGYLNYFSIAHLSQTLFSPWRRIAESYGRGFYLGRFLSNIIVNLFSRIIGAVARIIVIVIGIVVSILSALFGVAAVALWLILPAAIPLLLVFGCLLIGI